MRISDVHNVTGIPISTLKDLRHREILELATAGWPDDPDEVRRWGNFSVPAVMIIMAADEVRQTYGLSWQAAITFARLALGSVRVPVEGQIAAAFFDLRAVPEEIWAGRFDFTTPAADLVENWNYFAGTIDSLPKHLSQIRAVAQKADDRNRHRVRDHEMQNEVSSCIMINASRLCRTFWERARAANALRSWEDR
ncbi:hypothetical protein ORIO_06430 [Cereibacter azotoformans]|uniref:hypothetical protein n=1 Tax=Cereibacter azotoformans TaxID=43057 RepID=UPI001EEC0667|nr:hypothetical protein [Cereibacter azotoformans]ULB09560.1 hypothetical protein ORIO_06430 [Cereibacter azotoformans]